MQHHKLTVVASGLAVVLGLTGCGPSQKERAENERARLALEEQSRQETDAANKMITGLNQKLGRKPPVMDLNLPVATKPAPTPKKSPQP